MEVTQAWYQNWEFWTALVALLALVLSQLPPLHQLLRKPKLVLEAYSRLVLAQKVGNPNAQLHLILGNEGGRAARVRRIELQVTRDGTHAAVLRGENYLADLDREGTRLLTTFTVGPDHEWAHTVNFIRDVTREEVKEYRDAELALKSSIFELRRADPDTKELIEASPATVAPFAAMFERRFVWKPGEYQITISVIAEPASAGVSRRYRFTVFESESLELRQAADDLRFGDGVYWDSGKHAGVTFQLVEA